MMRPFEHPVACYCVLLRVFACCCVLLRFVAQRLEPVKLLSQQIPTFLSFVPWSLKRNVTMVDPFAQLLLKSFNIVGATHTYKTWLTNELYPSQQCLELIRPFARSLTTTNQWTHHNEKASSHGIHNWISINPGVCTYNHHLNIDLSNYLGNDGNCDWTGVIGRYINSSNKCVFVVRSNRTEIFVTFEV